MDEHPVAVWRGAFGREWTDRNPYTPGELDDLYEERYGTTRRALNERFLGDVPTDARILEVGMSTGVQLRLLKEQGYDDLYGVDVNEAVVREFAADNDLAEVRVADARALPFGDDTFDLVFTSGVLIHLPVEDLRDCLTELCRVSARYVWGFEYYAADRTEIEYRGHESFLWKDDFVDRYLSVTDAMLVREERVAYRGEDIEDTMFLLET